MRAEYVFLIIIIISAIILALPSDDGRTERLKSASWTILRLVAGQDSSLNLPPVVRIAIVHQSRRYRPL